MNIDGFGPAVAQALYENGLVKTVPDIYRLTVEDVMTLEGFKEKLAKLINSIIKSKSNPLDRLICGLGIQTSVRLPASCCAKSSEALIILFRRVLKISSL